MKTIQWTEEERNTILERGEVCYAVAEKAMERSDLSFDDIERINQHTENHRWGGIFVRPRPLLAIVTRARRRRERHDIYNIPQLQGRH